MDTHHVHVPCKCLSRSRHSLASWCSVLLLLLLLFSFPLPCPLAPPLPPGRSGPSFRGICRARSGWTSWRRAEDPPVGAKELPGFSDHLSPGMACLPAWLCSASSLSPPFGLRCAPLSRNRRWSLLLGLYVCYDHYHPDQPMHRVEPQCRPSRHPLPLTSILPCYCPTSYPYAVL